MRIISRTKHWWYKLLQQLHLWIGLILCLPLVMLGLTGSILVFEHELQDFFGKEKPVFATGDIQSVPDILAAAQNVAPEGTKPIMLIMPENAGEPAMVRFAPPLPPPEPGQKPVRKPMFTQITVDPVSLDIITVPESAAKLFRTIFMLHASLLIHEHGGRSIIGWLGIAMLTLSVSGLIIWWPRNGKWKQAFTVKRNAKGLRLHRDLHGATGIWGLVVLIVVSFSGVYLSFPEQTGKVINSVFPGRNIRTEIQTAKVTPVKGENPLDIAQIVTLAQEQAKDGTLQMVRFPMFPMQPYTVNFMPPGYTTHKPVIMIQVDQWQGKIINRFDPREYTTGETISVWQRVIHGGYGLGPIWRILIFFSGFLPLLFAITGTSMWLIKRRARARTELRHSHS